MSSCVHYKFTNSKDYDTITFEGLHISLGDFRDAVVVQKKLGKSPDFVLEVFNAQTKEDYKGDSTLIPRNASVLVKRVPVARPSKAGSNLAASGSAVEKSIKTSTTAKAGQPAKDLFKTPDIANVDAPECEKVMAIMQQAGVDHDPSKYMNLPSRGRGRPQVDPNMPLPQNYVCYRCHERGHHIRNCPQPSIRRWTGVPKQFLVPASSLDEPGAMVDYDGQAVVPKIDQEAKQKGKILTDRDIKGAMHLPKAQGPLVRVRIVPHELRCPLCKELLKDASLIPCCGKSYCDECIRNYLISHEFLCPSCAEKTLPDNLIPNVNLRHTAAKLPFVELDGATAAADSAESTAKPPASSSKGSSTDATANSVSDSPAQAPDSSTSPVNRTEAIVADSKNGNDGVASDRETPSAGTPTGSALASPKGSEHSDHAAESEEEKKAKIKKSLEKAAEKVLSAMPSSFLPSSRTTHSLFGVPPVLGVDELLNARRSGSPAVVAPLSKMEFYRMQREMRNQRKRKHLSQSGSSSAEESGLEGSHSRSISREVSRSRSVSRSVSPTSGGSTKSRRRTRDRSRSSHRVRRPATPPHHMSVERSHRPPYDSPHRYYRSRSRSPAYDRYREYYYRSRSPRPPYGPPPPDYYYRRHRSRSPRYRHSPPPMSYREYREYEYWLDRYYPDHHRSDCYSDRYRDRYYEYRRRYGEDYRYRDLEPSSERDREAYYRSRHREGAERDVTPREKRDVSHEPSPKVSKEKKHSSKRSKQRHQESKRSKNAVVGADMSGQLNSVSMANHDDGANSCYEPDSATSLQAEEKGNEKAGHDDDAVEDVHEEEHQKTSKKHKKHKHGKKHKKHKHKKRHHSEGTQEAVAEEA